jgi:glycosyltransferase involved in cell wall biosynthesis
LRVLPLLEQRGWGFGFWVPGRGPAQQELERRGYEVTTAERLLRFSPRGLREPPGPARRLASLPGYLRRWRAWLAGQDAVLVHANSTLSLPEVCARPRAGPPVLLQVHEVLPGGARGRAAATLARRADRVVCVSRAAAAPLRRAGLDPLVVHPAVPDPAAPGSPVPAHARTDRLVVGTLGTVCRVKGSDVFLAAVERIRERANGIEFRIVGAPVAGGERAWAEALLASARAQGVVHRFDVDPYVELSEWDVFVLPSRADAFPLAALEAMAVGLPVVASRVGGIPELLGEEVGMLVDPGDPEGVADAVLRLAASAQLRAALGAAGQERRRRLFSLDSYAEGLDRAYRATLDAGSRA